MGMTQMGAHLPQTPRIIRVNGYIVASWIIDDVRIYKYALTKEQIFNVMNGGASLKFGN